ncbi:MAG: hypothetical protein COA49_08570 [Bacteroidetes bacterium]|nr:MAG: hypothetical protein COA49_08570 [Bacteroidota bacterium]
MLTKQLTQRPLLSILILAAFLRIVASFMSEGYLMHDDHFWVVEAAASWTDGADYNNWMPWSQKALGRTPKPHYTNLAYSSLHYLYFTAVKSIGLSDPMSMMLILRLIHGMISLISVFLAFKITEALGGNRAAIWVGLAMAALFWMPIMSVHQMVEIACIPPLLASTWFLIKQSKPLNIRSLVLSGAFLGIATGLRYQVGVMGLGIVVAFVLDSSNETRITSLRNSIILGGSAITVFALTQLPTDLWLWGEPFAQLRAYIEYNLTESGNYPQGSTFKYLGLTLILLVPPISIALVIGYFRNWRKLAIIVLPSLAFLIFHSAFPNKQERFILPALPYILIAGTLGWLALRESSKLLKRKSSRIIEKVALIISLTLNVILLSGLTIASKNTSEVEAMYYLKSVNDLDSFLFVTADGVAFPPRFYSGSWKSYTIADSTTNIAEQRSTHINSVTGINPNYFVFVGDSHLGDLISRFKDEYPSLSYVAQFSPGRLDRIMNYLNPHNSLRRVMIYKIDSNIYTK